MPALPTAICPECGMLVTLDLKAFPVTRKGGCMHYLQAETVEGILFAAFEIPNTTTRRKKK